MTVLVFMFKKIVSWMIPMTSTHSNLVLLQLRVLLHLRWVRRPHLRRPLPLQPPPQQLLLLRVQLQVQLFTVAAMAMSMETLRVSQKPPLIFFYFLHSGLFDLDTITKKMTLAP